MTFLWLRRVAILVTLSACGPHTSASVVPTSGAERAQVDGARALDAPPAYFDVLVERAASRSREAYRPVAVIDADGRLARMRYDEHRRIRFRPEASLFRGHEGRFEAQFFHLGGTSRTPVSVSIVEGNDARVLPYDRASFTFDDGPLPDELVAPAYSGFRLHAPLNTDAYRDEVIVFQGASYFRAVARGEAYGLSARGLAIDTGTSRAEEFPVFDAFYLVPPRERDDHVWVLASLSSPRAEGAYAFRVTPGESTVVEVSARVFVRDGVEVLGLAPLTSMYLFGEDRPARNGDFRPEVHDSDTLVTKSGGGEWLARPLRNPDRTTVSSLRLDSPRGFGLAQRDRDFDHYQDLESRYHERPSVWIEPIGDWGAGAVRLLEIATVLETDDNVAAMWVPDVIPESGLALRYRITFGPSALHDGRAYAQATRIAAPTPGSARFLVDFVGASLADRRDVRVEVGATGGRVVEAHVETNPHTGGLRASFEVAADAADVELRAFLSADGDALTETWSYLWQPTR